MHFGITLSQYKPHTTLGRLLASIVVLPPSQQLSLLELRMSVPFRTATTKIAKSRFVVGPWCNRTLGGLGSTKNKFYQKNWAYLQNLTLQKALFRGVRALAPVPSKSRSALEETPRYIPGRLHTHTGSWDLRVCFEINVLGPGKTQKRPEYCLIQRS